MENQTQDTLIPVPIQKQPQAGIRFQEFWKHKIARSNNYNPGQIHCQLGESTLVSAQGYVQGAVTALYLGK